MNLSRKPEPEPEPKLKDKLKCCCALGVALLLIWTAGCVTPSLNDQEIQVIYNRTASLQYPDRNPVIVIPGSAGSRLVHPATGKIVWGALGGDAVDPRNPLDLPLIALPMRPDAPDPGVRPDGVLEHFQVQLLGLSVQLKAYFHILATLGAGGYRDESMAQSGAVRYDDDHYTCFQFDYDWRLDLASNAARLKDFIEEKRAYVREQTLKRFGVDRPDLQFDIVGHSMGGLLTRYFLRYGDQPLPADGSLPDLDWRGAEDVERVILVAPPNAGSYKAVLQLVNGAQRAPGLPSYPASIFATYPAYFQLLPRARHRLVVDGDDPERPLDLFDAQTWVDYEIGPMAPGEDETLRHLLPDIADAESRRRVAFDHLRRALAQAEQFHRALDRPARPPHGTELMLITGDSERTGQVVAVDGPQGEQPAAARVVNYGLGDGSVLRSSALMDERVGSVWQPRLQSPIAWDDVLFLAGRHLQLTKDPEFTNNVLFRLLEKPDELPPDLGPGSESLP